MKIIFLDIDGVLNCDKTPNPRKFPMSWTRSFWRGSMDSSNAPKRGSCSLLHGGVTPSACWPRSIGECRSSMSAPTSPKVRGVKEMQQWLADHPRVTRFAVIDDEDDELDDLPLFQPSSETGLTPEIAKGVERYLSGKTDETMRLNAMARLGQNIHSLFKRSKS